MRLCQRWIHSLWWTQAVTLGRMYVETLCNMQAKVEANVVVWQTNLQRWRSWHLAKNLLRRWVTSLSLHSQANRRKAWDNGLDSHLGESLSSPVKEEGVNTWQTKGQFGEHSNILKRRPKSYNQLQKWWDTPTEKRPFFLQIAPGHKSVKYNTDLPPPSHSKLFLEVLSMLLYC